MFANTKLHLIIKLISFKLSPIQLNPLIKIISYNNTFSVNDISILAVSMKRVFLSLPVIETNGLEKGG